MIVHSCILPRKATTAAYKSITIPWRGVVCIDEVRRNIAAAMRHWETQTCIRFINRSTQTDFIVFNSGRCG